MKKAMALVLSLIMVFSMVSLASAEDAKTYTIGICNLVDDASLNQIIQNIRERLAEISEEKGVQFEILEQTIDCFLRHRVGVVLLNPGKFGGQTMMHHIRVQLVYLVLITKGIFIHPYIGCKFVSAKVFNR